MIADQLAKFLPEGSNRPITNVAIQSNDYDILGLGVGVAPAPEVIIGTKTVFGSDMGIGGLKPLLECAVGTAFATATGATLNVQFQGAVDPGLAQNNTPPANSWQTFMETGGMTAAQLTAGQFFGRFDWPPELPPGFQPRFYRLNFVPLAGASFTAGTVAYAMVTMGRPDQANKFAGKNFAVAG